jgi:ribosomal protein S27AE
MGANWNKIHRVAVNMNNRSLLQEAHELVLTKYGRKCAQCGFDNTRALQIDHVNNDGAAEKKVRHSIGEVAYYKRVLADTSGKYQLLCANCNWIKRGWYMFKKKVKELPRFECPHCGATVYQSVDAEYSSSYHVECGVCGATYGVAKCK